MTNTEIIMDALKARGMTDDQLQQILTAYHGDLPFHTIPEWSRRGYHVKADAAPLFECYLWKHTSKPSRATIEAAAEAGEDAPQQSPHFYKHLSHIYSFSQVEKNAPRAGPGNHQGPFWQPARPGAESQGRKDWRAQCLV